MRRILIVLDSSDLPASILPVAQHYAARGDEIMLACILQPVDLLGIAEEIDGHHPDLLAEMATLRQSGIAVRAELVPAHDPTDAIDKATERFRPDLIARPSRRGAELLADAASSVAPLWERRLRSS
jgi:hypothetical protein